MRLLRTIFFLFTPNERLHAAILLVLMFIGAAFETVGIGLIVPFIGIIGDPTMLEKQKWLAKLHEMSHAASYREFLLMCGVGTMGLFVVKNLYQGYLVYYQNKFILDKHRSLAHRLLRAYLRLPYTFHLQRNSAELLRNISNVNTVVHGVLLPLFNVVIECMVVAMIAVMLLWVAPASAIGAVGALGLATVTFYRLIRKNIRKSGEDREHFNAHMLKWINQSVGGVKEIKILGREPYFLSGFDEIIHHYAIANRYYNTFAVVPRLFIETVAVIGIIVIALLLVWQQKNVATVLPLLSLFALATVRLMPSMTRILTNMSLVRFSQPALDFVHADLATALAHDSPALTAEAVPPLSLLKAIEIKDVVFRYPASADSALRKINLTIPKGHSVAFVGPSGSGKTTLVDVILGLLEPESGAVTVDGVNIQTRLSAWQQRLGYIPQSIYLADDSIRRNVAFGIEDRAISEERLWESLRAAQLEDFVKTLPKKLETFVGERGVRLSGGQRQRIGIARALYHNPDVLVLDEATSALDHETELEVTSAIDSLSGKKTLIVIAHRLSTARKCDRIFKIVDGQITASGTFAEVCSEAETR